LDALVRVLVHVLALREAAEGGRDGRGPRLREAQGEEIAPQRLQRGLQRFEQAHPLVEHLVHLVVLLQLGWDGDGRERERVGLEEPRVLAIAAGEPEARLARELALAERLLGLGRRAGRRRLEEALVLLEGQR